MLHRLPGAKPAQLLTLALNPWDLYYQRFKMMMMMMMTTMMMMMIMVIDGRCNKRSDKN